MVTPSSLKEDTLSNGVPLTDIVGTFQGVLEKEISISLVLLAFMNMSLLLDQLIAVFVDDWTVESFGSLHILVRVVSSTYFLLLCCMFVVLS